MNLELKNRLVKAFEDLFASGKFYSLFLLLQKGNYYLEVVWQNNIRTEWSDETDLIPLCYFYDFQLFDNRKELNKKLNNFSISKSQMAKDFVSISLKLGNDYMVGQFDELKKIIIEYDNLMEIEYENIIIEGGISFLIKGLEVMSFNTIDWDKGLDYGFTEEEFLNKIHTQTEINSITEQPFFSKFNEHSQVFLKSGTQLLQIVYDYSNNDLLDYSPLLYNFIKAVESETKELFLQYKNKIFSYTPIVISNIDKLDPNKYKDLKRLSDFCKTINRYNNNFEPSGLKPLYFILKYFFLRHQSKLTGIEKDILSDDVKIVLQKNKVIIDEIFHKGETRNDLVHSRIIDSKIEFFWHYADMYTILEVIANIKNIN